MKASVFFIATASLFTSVQLAGAAPASFNGSWAAKVPSPNGQRGLDVASRVVPRGPVDQSSVEGQWTGELPRGGSRFIAADFVFHVDGSTLVGQVRALDMDFPITNGTINGSHLAFTIGDTKGDYTGELAGDAIRMKVKYNDGENGRRTLDFTLTRVKQ